MERLEAKKIHGRTYYYYSKWAWTNGKCRRVWQKYLGKLENIVKAVDQDGISDPLYAQVFQWGLATALWKECCSAGVTEQTDSLCPKRDQGLSTGEYLAIAAINRAMSPASKRSIWEWFSQTVLLRHILHAGKAALESQRFWDHMDRIDGKTALSIWKNILKGVIKRDNIDLSHLSYDGTNFYTFIDTFNTRCTIAKRGKNKQGRNNLRQISYALFCSADGHIPLMYDVYEGSRNDARQFPLMLQKFNKFWSELSSSSSPSPNRPEITLIFDKGNNSSVNIQLLDSMKLHFVGSVKLSEHKELAQIPNKDPVFKPGPGEELEGTKWFRVTRKVYGAQRVLIVCFNSYLFNAQWLTLQNDIAKATEKLALLQQKLSDRANGVIVRGKVPTIQSIEKQTKKILARQYMNRIINSSVIKGSQNIPRLEYSIDADALHHLSNTVLGKTILITNRKEWDDTQIIKAYRSQYIIEDVFKEMKDRKTGNWWPLYHWTDSKIKVHGLYCTIALLLRALMLRRVHQAGIKISMKRLLTELNAIHEVVNIYPPKRRKKNERKQTVLTKTTEIQQKLMSVLEIDKQKKAVLG